MLAANRLEKGTVAGLGETGLGKRCDRTKPASLQLRELRDHRLRELCRLRIRRRAASETDYRVPPSSSLTGPFHE